MSYQPLPSHSGLDRVEKYGDNETPGSTEADSEDYPQPTPSKATISALVASLSLSVILNILFGILLYGRTSPSDITLSRAGSAEQLYCKFLPSSDIKDRFLASMCTAPARDAIRYEQKVFDELGTRTIYHGPPNDETDQAWYDLYMGKSLF